MIAIVSFEMLRHASRNALAAALLFGLAATVHAQESFKTPESAIEVLRTAAKSDNSKALRALLGPAGADIVSSGDAVADAATRQQFITAYDAKHQVTLDDDSKATMIIGQDDFPFPIPLVRKNGAWQFDTLAGRRKFLYRRIGRNEFDAIQASLAYVDAQNDYAETVRTGDGVILPARPPWNGRQPQSARIAVT